jgi:uncharacterized protein
MTASPLDVLQEFLADAFNPATVEAVTERLVAHDATYVSLNFDDPELTRIMPWAGTKHGKAAFVENFRGVRKQWTLQEFTPLETLIDGENVALFGRFTLKSVTLGRVVTSPMAVLAKVTNGRITYFQYMEDTVATARSFRSGGAWTINADPDAEPFDI